MSTQRWEYHTEFLKVGMFADRGKVDKWAPAMSTLGSQGWELVQVVHFEGKGTRDGWTFIYKRPVTG